MKTQFYPIVWPCVCVLLLAWAFAGAMFGWAKYKESKSWRDCSGGRDPGSDDPRNPFNIDPDDPADWWKHPPKEGQRA